MVLFAAIPMASAQATAASRVSVVPINRTVGGLTYGQLSEQWWQRAMSLTQFGTCANEPAGQVFFLGENTGGTSTSSCTVPAGKFIMFPVFNAEWSQAEAVAQVPVYGTNCLINGVNKKPIFGTDFKALSGCAKTQVFRGLPSAGGTLEADVDGQTLPNLTDFRAPSPPPLFTFTAVADNPFGLCPADGSCPLTTQAASDGFWIILNPLSAGTHTLHFSASAPFPELNFTFSSDVTYTLMVQ
jgi:hypothetical protein